MPDTVATPSTSYARQEQRRKLCRDEMGGTQAMRAASTEYLLKFDAEDWADYQVRLNDSFLVPYFENAVDNVVGKVFGKPLVLSETTPAEISDEETNTGIWRNVDLEGASADLFLYGVGRDAVVNGLSFVLVDMPKAGDGQRTVADEKDARPYWKHFKAQDVIEARVIYEDGLPKLQRLRVMAKADKPDPLNEWATLCTDRVLVYERGTKAKQGASGQPAQLQTYATFRVFEKHVDTKGQEMWDELPEEAGTFTPPRSAPPEVAARFVEIPCVAFYTEKIAPYEADPPLRDSLGDLCLQHWRKKSRLDTILDAVNTPIMTYSGRRADFEGAQGAAATPTSGYSSGGIVTDTTRTVNQRQLQMGPFTVLFAGAGPGESASIEWLEHGGVSITAGFADLERLERQIQQAALDPFTRQSQGTETATAEILAEGRTMTRAQVWATSWESSINSLLSWTAAWLGLEDGGTATFGKGVMESLGGGDFSQVVVLFEKGEIDGEALIAEAKRYGVLGPDVARAADAEQRAEERKMARQALAGFAAKAPAPASTPPSGEGEEEGDEEDAA